MLIVGSLYSSLSLRLDFKSIAPTHPSIPIILYPVRLLNSSRTLTQSNSANPSIDEFIRTFRAARKVYHKRALWGERWTRGEVAWRED